MSAAEIGPVKQVVETGFDTRIHQVGASACSFELASAQMAAWHEAGRFTVFNAGTYDLLTLNHVVGLVQCRVLGAMSMLGINKVETEEEQKAVHVLAASNDVHLMITMDTNTALERNKSRRKDKGGAPKPTLDWSTRATMLAMQSIPSTTPGVRRQAVDYITCHGEDCCAACPPGACVNADNALMTVKLGPKLVVVNADSTRTVADLERYKEEGLLPGTQIAINVEAEHQYHDPILGGPVKTTDIINRIRS